MRNNLIDFDAWRAERDNRLEGKEAEPVMFKIGGKEYPMPPEPPASVVLDILYIKETEGDDADVPMSTLGRIGRAIFGKEAFDEILDENRLPVSDLGEMLMQAFKAWPEEVTAVEEADPNSIAPETGQEPSIS